MEKVMEQLKQELQCKLETELKERKFIIKETEENGIKEYKFYFVGHVIPFLIIAHQQNICLYFYPAEDYTAIALLGKIISPQIEILHKEQKYKVVLRHFENGIMKQDEKEMSQEEVMNKIVDNIKIRF